MPQAIFAYHLGMDAEQYAFFRIPKLLITEPYFRRLSTDAKLLYGLMLDRMSLSMRNGWMDDDGHVYIYFTLEEACEQLCCKTDKAVKLFAELDSAKGVGLIRRVKQGLGRPAKIYVLRFMGIEDEPGEDTPKAEPPSCRNPDFGKTEVKSSEKPKSGPRKIRSQDLGKTECNKTDKNNTELSNTDSSIHPGAQPEEVIEEYRKEIRENIEYDHLRRQHPYDDIDEIADLMLEVLCTQGSFMRIGGKQLYTALVKERFLKLDSSHIEYVLDCLRESTADIRNIKAYLLEIVCFRLICVAVYKGVGIREHWAASDGGSLRRHRLHKLSIAHLINQPIYPAGHRLLSSNVQLWRSFAPHGVEHFIQIFVLLPIAVQYFLVYLPLPFFQLD